MNNILIAVLLSFAIVLVLGPIVIPALKKHKAGNTEREELAAISDKSGTPSMGGIMILISVLVTSMVFVSRYPKVLPVLLLTIGFGLIGFLDDFLKVILRRSDGLIAWQKLLLEIVVTTIFLIYLLNFTDVSLEILLPFSGGAMADVGWLAIPILYFAVIGTVNGVNFTDGVDGLATSVTAVVALFFALVSTITGGGIEPVAFATFGALLGFLVFNVYPAKIFMGDTGSLALGGFVAACAYMLHMPLFILIVGFIYLIEVLSVILQVSYFKITHGKRIFKMAPIHHHFELCGWSEAKVVAIFTIATILLCFVGFSGLFSL